MSDAPWEALEKILDGYRKGFRDKMKTIAMVGQIHSGLSPLESPEFRRILIDLYQNSDMTNKAGVGYVVNEAALAVSCLSEFYPPQFLPDLVFSTLQTQDAAKIEAWAQYVVPELQWNLTRLPDRFPPEEISYIKALIAQVRCNVPSYSPNVLFAMDGLERAAEYMEFERFASSLPGGAFEAQTWDESLEDQPSPAGLDPIVAKALKRAEEHLLSRGEFGPKSAADLIRSVMDEAHRIIVQQLETIKGKPYEGGESDGARRSYMRSVDFITLPEEAFFSAIYSLISQEGSHKLIAPRETILLLYQTVSNYIRLLTERLNREIRP
jgi:hypothetical protein